MILATADCADGKGPPPPELTLAWQAERWHTLPEPGGMRDQVAGELERMAASANVFDTVRSFRASKNWAQWSRANKDAMKIMDVIMKLRANG